jgi:hypothetical protein
VGGTLLQGRGGWNYLNENKNIKVLGWNKGKVKVHPPTTVFSADQQYPLKNKAVPSGELSEMLMNLSDDWATSDDELNFAEDSANESEEETMAFDGSSSSHVDNMVFAETSDSMSHELEFAESSEFAMTSDSDMGQ